MLLVSIFFLCFTAHAFCDTSGDETKCQCFGSENEDCTAFTTCKWKDGQCQERNLANTPGGDKKQVLINDAIRVATGVCGSISSVVSNGMFLSPPEWKVTNPPKADTKQFFDFLNSPAANHEIWWVGFGHIQNHEWVIERLPAPNAEVDAQTFSDVKDGGSKNMIIQAFQGGYNVQYWAQEAFSKAMTKPYRASMPQRLKDAYAASEPTNDETTGQYTDRKHRVNHDAFEQTRAQYFRPSDAEVQLLGQQLQDWKKWGVCSEKYRVNAPANEFPAFCKSATDTLLTQQEIDAKAEAAWKAMPFWPSYGSPSSKQEPEWLFQRFVLPGDSTAPHWTALSIVLKHMDTLASGKAVAEVTPGSFRSPFQKNAFLVGYTTPDKGCDAQLAAGKEAIKKRTEAAVAAASDSTSSSKVQSTAFGETDYSQGFFLLGFVTCATIFVISRRQIKSELQEEFLDEAGEEI